MQNCKYVVMKHQTKGETIFIFGPTFIHRHMAGKCRSDFEQPVGAGFLRIRPFSIPKMETSIQLAVCFGESESLKMKSRPVEDSILASLTLGLVQCVEVLPESYLEHLKNLRG